MSTPTPPTTDVVTEHGNATGSDAQSGRESQSGWKSNNYNNKGKKGNNSYLNHSRDKDFVGAEPKVGAVLGLRMERITKKVTIEVFTEN